jgi:hypothetical protein
MPTLVRPALTDQTQVPTEAVVRSHLGESGRLWEALSDRLHEEHSGFDEEWRYYRDGKSWLLKVTHGSRTICWVSVGEGAFALTVYLPARAAQQVAGSSLPADLKAQFLDADPAARTHGITVVFREHTDRSAVQAAVELLTLRDRIR